MPKTCQFKGLRQQESQSWGETKLTPRRGSWSPFWHFSILPSRKGQQQIDAAKPCRWGDCTKPGVLSWIWSLWKTQIWMKIGSPSSSIPSLFIYYFDHYGQTRSKIQKNLGQTENSDKTCEFEDKLLIQHKKNEDDGFWCLSLAYTQTSVWQTEEPFSHFL